MKMGKKRWIAIGGAAVVLSVILAILLFRQGRERKSSDTASGDESALLGPTGLPAEYDEPGLTAEQRSERIEHVRKMHADLPGNLLLPPLPGDEGEGLLAERDKKIEGFRKAQERFEAGNASPADRKTYYEYRIKFNEDKTAMLRYIAVKKPDATGQLRIAPNIEEMIQEMAGETASFRQELLK